MADIVHLGGGQLTVPAPIEDHFALAFAPARPTFDALAKLKPARTWLGDETDPNRNALLLKVKPAVDWIEEAEGRLALIPDETFLKYAGLLFRDAEHIPAPEEWYPLAFGAMLAAAPNAKNIAPDYTFGLVDLILYDEGVCERRYEQGFSCAVVATAIREVRRTSEFVPAAATIIKICQQNRRRFRELQWTVETLIRVRQNSADVCAEFDRQWREDFGGDDEESIGGLATAGPS